MKTKCFEIVQLPQGSFEWLEWRHKGIGASDAPTIMNENPYKTLQELLEEKCGPPSDINKNEAMIRGTKLEPEARKRYITKTGIDVHPACLQSTRYNWLRTSLDGLSVTQDSVVEIKCGESVYRKTALYNSVPDYYFGQLQHILAVTGFERIDFWCYLPNRPGLLINVDRDEDYIEQLLNRELEFWEKVRENT
jgi:putative phage-type endonuclease